jgi:signal transduction histidine kinase
LERAEVRRLRAILSAGETRAVASLWLPSSVGQRIARELHDTVKQNLCGAAMMIEACVEAHGRDEDPALVRDLLRRALDMTREAEHQLSKPLEDLARSPACGAAATASLKERFERLGADFGLRTHESLEAPLEVLCRSRIVAAHRVCMEAFWNAAKHSGAENLWLESRLAGGAFVLAVRDDGCGFRDEYSSPGGMGLALMRSRAEEVGAALEILSAPGEGTTVRLRLSRRSR